MATEQQVRLTYRDYLDLPESADRCELIDGEYYIMSGPSEDHQDAVGNIYSELRFFVRRNRLGKVLISPFDVILSPHDVFQPDVMFVSNERLHLRTGDDIRGAPDLVVEVLSPSTAHHDRVVKRERYAMFGVQEYWIVDTASMSVEVMVAQDGIFENARMYREGQTMRSPLLSCFQMDVSSIFAEF